MGLRVEENFGMQHVLSMDLLQVCPGQVVKILFTDQYICPTVINVKKFLKVIEIVGCP